MTTLASDTAYHSFAGEVEARIPPRYATFFPSPRHQLLPIALNAPAETLAERAAYNTPFQSQRCLVPINGFYEWQLHAAKKQPDKIALRNGALIAFAALWEKWTSDSGASVETFTIITTGASKLLSEVHSHMPVIIAPTDYQLWLTASSATAKKLLLSHASGLTLTPIGERVNNIENDDAELLLPLSMS